MFKEIRKHELEFKRQRSLAKSAYNKYKRVCKKYEFLNILVKPQHNDREDDEALEIAILDYFASLGLRTFKPPTDKDFDVIINDERLKLGVEVKNGQRPSENEMFQAVKYLGRNNELTNCILVWNNFGKHEKKFDQSRILDAQIHNYAITTTEELHRGYLSLKNDYITLEQFLNQFKKTGFISFTRAALSESINSGASDKGQS